MIKEDIDNLRVRDFVTRICDHCGREDILTIDQITQTKNRKKYGKDYCKKCSYIYRDNKQLKGGNSPFWKGGLSINKTSGYLRVNKTNEYYHKKILGDHLGRKLTKKEQVHHIDMDKLNNELDNLFLCVDKSHHHSLHTVMQNLAFELFIKGELVFFDKKRKLYVLYKCKNEKILFVPSRLSTCRSKWHNEKYYSLIYLGNKKHMPYSRFVVEEFSGKKIGRNIHVHHIDGDSMNNDINNLVVLTRKQHKKCHNSLQNCVAELYKTGVIKFNKETGEYYE